MPSVEEEAFKVIVVLDDTLRTLIEITDALKTSWQDNRYIVDRVNGSRSVFQAYSILRVEENHDTSA